MLVIQAAKQFIQVLPQCLRHLRPSALGTSGGVVPRCLSYQRGGSAACVRIACGFVRAGATSKPRRLAQPAHRLSALPRLCLPPTLRTRDRIPPLCHTWTLALLVVCCALAVAALEGVERRRMANAAPWPTNPDCLLRETRTPATRRR
ncbi:hypothetical protein VTK73DRAFT_5681 [Phialemonium thermophilum]|uniref:Uncharacterized protein n=1 Tax=Phialemonium thermophilum TaxID=223376 RepID=A0ABR3V0T1_9PEZI